MHRRRCLWLLLLTASLAVTAWSRAWADDKANPTGTWKYSFATQNGQTIESTLKLKLDGGKLTGTVTGRDGQDRPIEEASYKDGEVTFQVTRERDGQKFVIKYRARVTGDTLKGTVSFDAGGESRSRDFEAKRAAAALGADLLSSLKKGSPDLKSAGPLAFGPQGILFVGDTQGAAIFAFDTDDRTPSGSGGTLKIESIDEKIAALLGTTAQNLLINDLAVNPATGRAYLSVSRGKGPDSTPVLVRSDRAAKLEAVSLADIPHAKAPLPNAPDPAAQTKGQSLRSESITDLAYIDGRVFVAGLSNEEFSSRLLAIPFPFSKTDPGTSLEIYHGAHGRFETKSPIRTFAPFQIGGDPHLLAAYTCTPLVKFPVSDLKPGTHLKGTTVAELGNRNRPLDMIVYQKGGKDFLLMANSSRGVMKITTAGIDKAESITDPVSGGGTRGQSYETISELKGILQLDALDEQHALVLVRTDGGALNLETIALP
jgi:hypothetical protein